MNISHLREFAELAKRLNFTSTAHALHMTQPALSSHIQSMERETRAQLIERPRSGRPARLTPAGQRFLTGIEQILSTYDTMLEDIDRLRNTMTGKLVIKLPREEYGHPLVDFVAEFMHDYPQIDVAARQWDSSDSIDDVLSGSIDCACIGSVIGSFDGIESHPELTSVSCAQSEVCIWIDCSDPLAKTDKLTPEMLDGRRLVIPANRQHKIWKASAEAFTTAFNITCELGNLFCDSLEDFILSKVQPGDILACDTTIAGMSVFAVRPERMLRTFDPPIYSNVAIVYRRDADNPALTRFVEFISRHRDNILPETELNLPPRTDSE